jgi:hypothetical protein
MSHAGRMHPPKFAQPGGETSPKRNQAASEVTRFRRRNLASWGDGFPFPSHIFPSLRTTAIFNLKWVLSYPIRLAIFKYREETHSK